MSNTDRIKAQETMARAMNAAPTKTQKLICDAHAALDRALAMAEDGRMKEARASAWEAEDSLAAFRRHTLALEEEEIL